MRDTLFQMFEFIENFFVRDYKLRKVAGNFNAEYIFVNSLIGIKSLANLKLWVFRYKAVTHIMNIFGVQKKTFLAYKESLNSNNAIMGMYKAEYGGPKGPHYRYLNSLLFKKEFEAITGLKESLIGKAKIIDIGAGSNELLRFIHDEFLTPSSNLYGSDISPESAAIIKSDGFNASVGRIENLNFSENYFDIVFLSYFIDYDTDQFSTFKETTRIVNTGGKIVLEGYFPSRPRGLLKEDIKNEHLFVTKGRSASEDISLVCSAFIDMGKEQGKHVCVERIVSSSRYLFNRRGLKKLPSFFIVANVL